ncbi:MAG TPA: MFS transporter [Steroidobacteraceae bacterium]|nr:MFS transporter [Steroidobacteraceae bacterium]
MDTRANQPPTTREYDDAPLRLFHIRVATSSSGGAFSDGYGLGIIGIALSGATSQLSLTPVWIGLLGGASLAGLFAGALLTGPAADRYGRRPIFVYNMVILAVLSALQLFVHSGAQLLVLRVAIGFLLGTDYVVNKALLIEFTPRRVRGRIMGLLSVAWAGGYACAYAVGFALAGRDSESWRWMLLSSAVPCLLVLPLRVTLPESPLWLVNHGLGAAAAAVVRAKFGAGVALPHSTPAAQTHHGRWRRLFAPALRRYTLVACIFFTCLVIPYFAVGTFVSQVMSAMHLKSNYVGGLIYNVGLLVGAIVGLLVVDRLTRRTVVIGSLGLAAVIMLILSASTLPAVVMIVLFAAFAFLLSTASNLVYVYVPELFPTDLRASGIGLAIASSRIGSAISTFLLPIIVDAYGIRTALAACVAVLALGAALCQRWAPETSHLPLGALDDLAMAHSQGEHPA